MRAASKHGGTVVNATGGIERSEATHPMLLNEIVFTHQKFKLCAAEFHQSINFGFRSLEVFDTERVHRHCVYAQFQTPV
jgi:hypothetical protein